MRYELSELQRRALGLQAAGLYTYAEQALLRWWAAAAAQQAWASASDAGMRAVRLALDRDRPSAALSMGAEVLPQILGRSYTDPNVMARLYIFLAKAAWRIGREAELRAFTDAARCTLEHESVEPLVRAHFGVIRSLVALQDGDFEDGTAWALQALDVAEAVSDEAAVVLCRQNLSYLWTERGQYDRARAAIADLVAPGLRDVELVDVLVNGVHIAIGQGDLLEGGRLARRALDAYCAAPSLLSPISVGFLFEALAHWHAAAGSARATELLGITAHGWFALSHRQRDALRIERWLAGIERPAAPAKAQVDPDLLYLGDLLAAAHQAPGGSMGRMIAATVHRLLREVQPAAAPAPCEHAALLQPLAVGERWFTGRSAAGQAAERVLSGADAPGRAMLDLLGAYERLAAAATPWPQALRAMRRVGLQAEGLAALHTLYREATA